MVFMSVKGSKLPMLNPALHTYFKLFLFHNKGLRKKVAHVWKYTSIQALCRRLFTSLYPYKAALNLGCLNDDGNIGYQSKMSRSRD